MELLDPNLKTKKTNEALLLINIGVLSYPSVSEPGVGEPCSTEADCPEMGTYCNTETMTCDPGEKIFEYPEISGGLRDG